MIAGRCYDKQQLVVFMRGLHGRCDEAGKVAAAGLLETWIDEGERGAWFLCETSRRC